ncbi:MAG: glycosyltransferase family 4 protein [Phycisphaerae bacterium]|nr:glycosyltransferase family 4 protein [Planctomycetia bacterium]MCL4719042.1 glycosyltransferase family 4 protein [Phycisphaerae bacterium]NUQ07831.1 glycosyltransferase family 4 protein [Phycisphaerae bacterium]
MTCLPETGCAPATAALLAAGGVARPPRFRVLAVGPDPREIGGMSTVVAQMLELDWGPRGEVRFQRITTGGRVRETMLGKLRRHGLQTRTLRKRIRREGINVLHMHTCSGASFWRSAADMTTARGSGCATVLHVHGAMFDQFVTGSGRTARRLVRLVLERADAVIALGEHWARAIRACAPRANIRVIPNAVEIPPMSEVGKTGREAGAACRFLLLAKLDAWKGVADLIEAAVILERSGAPFELVLAGPGGSAGSVKAVGAMITARGLSTRVRCVGPLCGAARTEALRHADVLVQPSHHEGMPMSVLEAMSFGKAVVASQVGALPEVVEEGRTGLLVPPQDPAALARAMLRLVHAPELRHRLGDAGRRVIGDRFSLDRWREALIDLYEDLLAERLRRHSCQA